MGLLDWFRRRPTLDVVCWLDDASRWQGFARAVQADLAAGRHVLVVAHFKQTLAAAGETLARAAIPFEARVPWTSADRARLRAGAAPAVILTLAGGLPPISAEGTRSTTPGSDPVTVKVVDLHVLAAENDRVLAFATTLAGRASARAHVSLEDPVLTTFARPWVRDLMSRLGMKPDDPIESSMVTTGVHRALAKLAKKVTGNAPCTSAAEWLERNLGA